jgi:hypothetical protein
MKPGEKGWLKEYLEFRKDILKDLNENIKQSTHPEHSLYRVIQPTGLMYGQPVSDIDYPGSERWDEKDRIKLLLAESLINSSLLFHEKPIKNPDELSQVILKSLEKIGNFYNTIFPELATPTKNLFGKKKTPLELAEKILDKRIDRSGEFSTNFWTQFFHNSLFFLDIFIFGQWIHTNADRIVSDFFKYESEELRFAVVKVIACAAHANANVEYEERRLLDFFLQSTDLSPEKKKDAKKLFNEGISIEEINLPILTIWADKRVEDSEMQFLKQLSTHVGFSEDDLENSLIAIEGFVLEHWDQLTSLQNKQDYQEVSERFISRMNKVTSAHKSRLLKEVHESKALMSLLSKAKSHELTDQEKSEMQEMLIAVLKTIPTFVIISLPQRFLTLPMLLKILPQNFFAEVNK